MRRHLGRQPEVWKYASVSQMLDGIAPGVKTYERLGVVVDADLAPVDRWAQVRDRLRHGGVEVPDRLEQDGFVADVKGGGRCNRVGVWIMPDNTSPGMLEVFLGKLVPPRDPCWQHALDATTVAVAKGAALAEKDFPKGRLHAWLAWQAEPGLQFGTALRAKVFDANTEDAERFVAWFRRLFLA